MAAARSAVHACLLRGFGYARLPYEPLCTSRGRWCSWLTDAPLGAVSSIHPTMPHTQCHPSRGRAATRCVCSRQSQLQQREYQLSLARGCLMRKRRLLIIHSRLARFFTCFIPFTRAQVDDKSAINHIAILGLYVRSFVRSFSFCFFGR
jgi:hypothetical protein